MGISRNIRDRLIAIETTMEYDDEAVKAAKYIPEEIQPFQLPLFVNFPTGGARVQYADTFYRITRTWRLSLWGRKEGDGLRAENEERMLDLTDLVYDLFVSRTRLELNGAGLTHVLSGILTGDSGIQLRPYPAHAQDTASFYMVDFSMDVTYRSTCR